MGYNDTVDKLLKMFVHGYTSTWSHFLPIPSRGGDSVFFQQLATLCAKINDY